MIFQFTASPQFDFITQFARQIKVPVRDNVLEIPKKMGKGYVRKVVFDDNFRLLIHHYTLKEDLVVKRNPAVERNDLRSIFFYSNEQAVDLTYNDDNSIPFSRDSDSAIQVTTNDLSSVIRFPAHTGIQYMVVGITASKLKSLLSIDNPNTAIKTITNEDASFLFFESMNAETRLLLKNIAHTDMNDALNHFYLRIKVQELLYLLFSRLSARENSNYRRINSAEAERLMIVRNEILNDLSRPPVLNELAQMAGMGETKLKQLFKQTFGETIYNYFQKARMEEAAFLLKQAKLSVSEAGYELGFSNLSHFSRLFQRHYGITPKKYTSAG
ncbi:MAG TPA: AraC family transcriptional regulator [Cyclobacteriaceae bacterium]